jgi:hypothetical protein
VLTGTSSLRELRGDLTIRVCLVRGIRPRVVPHGWPCSDLYSSPTRCYVLLACCLQTQKE